MPVSNNPVVVSILAGATTGGIECFVTYPTEYVKTHLQLGKAQYKGMLDCAVQTVRTHGPLGLYRGMSTLLVGSIPKQAVRWGTFEASAGQLRNDQGQLTPVRRVVCGFVAGAAEAALAVTPTETVKTAFIEDQRGPQRFRGLIDGIRTITREQGLSGLYRGAFPTMMKQGTNQAVRFPAQFAALQLIAGSDPAKRKSPVRNGIAGVMAGVVSVVVTQPMDLVKTRMQGATASMYQSSLQCLVSVIRSEGFGVLYAGTLPRMVRVGANVGLTFTLFPLVKKLYQ